MQTIERQINAKLTAQFELEHLEVVNESNNHNVPPNSESHFKVILVSPAFVGLVLVKRHRLVNTVLADELENHIHALAIHTYTRDEWQKKHGAAPLSPPCLGGSQ